MFWKTSFWLLAVWLLAACSQPSAEIAPRGLVNAGQLIGMLESGERLQLIDVRPPKEYLSGHIPGAINIWRTDIQRTDTAYNGLRVSSAQLAELLGAKGVSSGMSLVLYDAKGCVDAARLWWLLRIYGHDDVALLNGGLSAWDGPLTKGDQTLTARQFEFLGTPMPSWTIDYPEFENLRQHNRVRLIDTRSDPEFSGTEKKNGAFMAGHIPGAIQYDYSHAIDYSEKGRLRFKPVEQLRSEYGRLARQKDTVVVYCHSGVRSAHTLFVLSELLGYENARNYDGSWIEWSFFNSPDYKELQDKTQL